MTPSVPAAPVPPHRRWSLAFRDRTLEAAFLRQYTRDALPAVRRAILVATILYGPVFAVNDWLIAPHLLREAWTLRAVVFVVGMGVYAASRSARFRHHWQPLVASLVAIAGAGLIGLMAIDSGPVTSGFGFNGPVLVIVAAYVLFRLRLGVASLAGWSIVVAFVVVALFVRDLPTGRVFASLILFTAGNFLGMVAAYGLERSARTVFAQARDLDARRRESLRLLGTRERFFASVSHELRTPLTLVAAPLRHVLDTARLDDSARADLDTAARSADRLLRLVTELLDLARLDAGHLRLNVARHDAAAFLAALVDGFRPAASAKGVALDLTVMDASDGAPLEAVFDAHHLHTAAANLVANAVKFTPAGGRVAVRLDADDDVLRIAVDDDGPGVGGAETARVFERFRQGGAGERVGGSGLGLALAREVARLHGGEVALEAKDGPGARFVLTIPRGGGMDDTARTLFAAPTMAQIEAATSPGAGGAIADEGEATRAESAETEPPETEPAEDEAADERPLVLVVDDDADIRAFVGRLLGDLGRIVEAADGDEGLARARDLVPDLVVTDVMMPGLDGHALVRAIRADAATAHVPVLMLTARAGEESRLAGLASGVDDYLAKPFAPRELRARVEAAFARTARLRRHFAPPDGAGTLGAGPGGAGPGGAGPGAAMPAADGSPRVPAEIAATPVEVTSADAAFVGAAQAAVEARLADLQLGTDLLAADLVLSRRQLERKLRALTGLAPADFIRRLRLSRAADLLGQGYGSVSEVAFATGFANASHFARVFRERYGVAPSEWTGGAGA